MSVKVSKRRIVLNKTPEKVNHVAFLIDVSGSMHGLESKVAELCNKNINDLREQSLKHGQKTIVSILIFDTRTDVIVNQVPIEKMRTVTYSDVSNRNGMTRLMDGIGYSINFLKTTNINVNDDNSFLLIGLTDGDENDSKKFNRVSMKQLVDECNNEGNWTLVFNVPPGAKKTITNFGLYSDNVREWETTTKGLEVTSSVNTFSLNNYYNSRSAGNRSVKNFYEVDLGSLQTKDLKKLDNLQDKFKLIDVERESPIKEFVESKGYNYIPGSCFYELTKKETVQANKEILVQEKGKAAIYGGDEARNLIGIPKQDVKVEPLNLSKYRVFVLSTSVNRKLVRGTKLAVTIQ